MYNSDKELETRLLNHIVIVQARLVRPGPYSYYNESIVRSGCREFRLKLNSWSEKIIMALRVSIHTVACAIREHDESRLYHRRVPFTSLQARVNNSLYSQFTQLLL